MKFLSLSCRCSFSQNVPSGTEQRKGLFFWHQGDLTTLGNSKLRQVDDFKYLGSWIDQKKKDIEICKEKAWAAGNELTVLWKSNLNRDLKIHFFRTSVAFVLLYGSDSWTWQLHQKNNLMAATCCSKHKLKRSYISQRALWGSASNFKESPDTSAAV